MLMSYKDKEFRNVSSGDLGLEPDANDEQVKAAEQEHKELFEFMKETLADKVTAVKASTRLKTHPVCLSAEGDVSIEMEKVLNAMPNSQEVKADKVLEVNTSHEVFQSLKNAFEQDREKVKLYTNLLYNQALLIEGLPLSDPLEFTNDICKIMV